MHSSWIFKPKYGADIYKKVLRQFVNEFLSWFENGIDWHTTVLKDGWVEMQASCDGGGSLEYYAETCFSDTPLTGTDLTEHMMILLVEAGVVNKYDVESLDDGNPSQEYSLEDVDICQVIAALSEQDTNVYSPWGSKCWVYPVGPGPAKTVDMLDVLLTLQAA